MKQLTLKPGKASLAVLSLLFAFLSLGSATLPAEAQTLVYDSSTNADFATAKAAASAGQVLVNGNREINGGIWSISGGTLVENSSDGNGYKTDLLVRPDSENQTNESATVTIPAGGLPGGSAGVAARFQSSSGNYYLFNFTASYVNFYSIVGGGPTALGSNSFSLNTGDVNTVHWEATGTSPTTLKFVVTDTTTNTVVYTGSVQDSTATLQQAGALGVVGWSINGYTISRLQTYNLSQVNLSVGSVSAAATASGITLSLSSPLAGGSSAGYGYKVYRDTQPAVATTGTPYASPSSFPYTDSAATDGKIYFYKVIGTDSAGSVANAIPAGLTGATGALALAVPSVSSVLAIAYGGDSITYGQNLASAGTTTATTAPYWCDTYLSSLNGTRLVTGSNQGHSGHAWDDFLPSSSTGDFAGLESGMNALLSASPGAVSVFSLMLGTNDSATYKNHTPAQVTSYAETVIDKLLVDFPASKVVVHSPPLYTPNTQNGGVYLEAGLALLVSYQPALDAAVAYENGLHPGRVFTGSKAAPAFFANTYQTELQGEGGSNGTFFLHPNAQGAQDLGRLWATGIYNALYAPAVTSTSTYLAPTLTHNTSGQLVITWPADSAATGYKVLRSVDGGNTYTLIATVAAGTLTFATSATPAGQTYYWHVVASH